MNIFHFQSRVSQLISDGAASAWRALIVLGSVAGLWSASSSEAEAGYFDCTITGTGTGPVGAYTIFLDLDNDSCSGTSPASGNFLNVHQVADNLTYFSFYNGGSTSAGMTVSGGVAISSSTGIYAMDCRTTCTLEFSYGGTNYSTPYTYSGGEGTFTDPSSSAPEIGVTSSESSGGVTDGGTDSWSGSPSAGADSTMTYTISNSGTAALTLTTPDPSTHVSGESNVAVSGLDLTSTTVAAGSSATLTVTYRPAAIGAFSFNLDILSNDTDEDTFDIAVSGATASPEITVEYGGSGFASDADNDLGSSFMALEQQTAEFTVKNEGNGVLNLTGLSASALSNAAVDSMAFPPGISSLAAGASTTLTVKYTPALAGGFSWRVSLANDDPDDNEAPFLIDASGSSAGEPEISVLRAGAGFASGTMDALGSGFTAGAQQTVQYTVTNSGTADLSVGQPAESSSSNVTISSMDLSPAVTSLSPGDSTVLTVTYAPVLDGAFSWALSLGNSDADEGTFVFQAGGAAAGEPEIAVDFGGASFASGDTAALGSGLTAGVQQTAQFTVSNNASADLVLGSPSARAATQASVGSAGMADSTIAPGGSAALTVSYTPARDGSFSWTVELGSNDSDATPFVFNASGTAAGVPSGLAATSGSGQAADMNTAFDAPLAATVTDANGYGVSNVSVTFFAPASGASVTFAATGNRSETVVTDANGVAESSAMTANGTSSDYGSGGLLSYAVTASAAGLQDVSFQLTNNRDTVADVEKTQEVIGAFVRGRADRIVSAQPDLVPRLRASLERRSSGANSLNFSSMDRGQSLSFDLTYRSLEALMDSLNAGAPWSPPQHGGADKTGLPPLRSSVAAADAALEEVQPFAFAGAAAEEVLTPAIEGRWDIWLQGAIAFLDTENGRSENGFVFAGADYRVSEDAIVGVMGQLDISEENNPSENTSAEGIGWMVGPYAVVRLQDDLYFDGRVTFGKSYNDVDALGLFKDEFDTNRLLVQAGLTGDIDMGQYVVSPFARAIYYWEEQEAYTDSLGNLIPSQTFDLGRFEFGPEVRYRTGTAKGNSLSWKLSLAGVYDFDKMDETPATDTGVLTSADEVRARVTAGLTYSVPRKDVLLHGELFYDGIGASGFKATGGSFSFRMPF